MSVCIVHLSDIHFSESRNPIEEKMDQIAGAICSIDPSCADYILVLSGDVANEAKGTEYQKADSFLKHLQLTISTRIPKARIRFILIPGNHDCHLPKDAVSLRELLVAGIQSTIQTASPEASILDELLRSQSDYFTFAERHLGPLNRTDRICKIVEAQTDGGILQFNLYNTALTSRRDESQLLSLPMKLVESIISARDHCALSVSVFHHPYTWFDADIAEAFRTHIDSTSDFALTGHQHSGHAFLKEHRPHPQHIFYSEGDVLQERGKPQISGFRLLYIDIETTQRRLVTFKWKDDFYASTDAGWEPFKRTASLVKKLTPTDELRKRLADPGINIVHSKRGILPLDAFFVYPDAAARALTSVASVTHVSGGKLFDFISSKRQLIIQAGARMGKTCLARMLARDWLGRSASYPLLIRGSQITKYDMAALSSLMTVEAVQHYGPDSAERYRQLTPSQRVLLIDDWDHSPLNPVDQETFLANADKLFANTVVFVSSAGYINQLMLRAAENKVVPALDILSLKEMSFVGRGHLIDRWTALDVHPETPEFTLRVKEADRLIKAILGRHTLPSLPFIILSILTITQRSPDSVPENGSFGFLYEVLITSALNFTQSDNAQLEKKYTFLSQLAYHLFESNETVIDSSGIHRVLDKYAEDYIIKIDKDTLLKDLTNARVLIFEDGLYAFAYPHYSYYFLARYFKNHLNGENGSNLRSHLRTIARSLPAESNNIFLIFVLYLTQDQDSDLMNELVKIANEVLSSTKPADLSDDDVGFYNSQAVVEPAGELPAIVDYAQERQKRREAEDREAERQLTQPGTQDYSEELPLPSKLVHAEAYIEILGQVLRNFTGSLPGPSKLTILRTAISLGLRALRAQLTLVRDLTAHLQKAIRVEEKSDSPQKGLIPLLKAFEKFISELTHYVGFTSVHSLSLNIGSVDIDESAYSTTLAQIGKSDATNLVAFAINLEHGTHPNGFPLEEFRELLREAEQENRFLYRVLVDLAVDYLEVIDIGYAMRHQVLNLIGYKPTEAMLSGLDKRRARVK